IASCVERGSLGCNELGPFPARYLDKGTPESLLTEFLGTGNKGVTGIARRSGFFLNSGQIGHLPRFSIVTIFSRYKCHSGVIATHGRKQKWPVHVGPTRRSTL